jgi:tetratricopeptide (TPR) repeat protein
MACDTLQDSLLIAQGATQTSQARRNLAQCYYAEGEQSLYQRNYAAAIVSLTQALASAQAPDQIIQVNEALYQAYNAESQTDQKHRRYALANESFEQAFTYAAAGYGPSSEQARQAAEAAGENGLAEAQLSLSAHAYQQAAVTLTQMVGYQNGAMVPLWDKNLYPQVHRLTAAAYFGLARQQMARGDCSDATATFQIILSQYHDTPEAVATTTIEHQPPRVVGQVLNGSTPGYPPMRNVQVFLSASWQVSPRPGTFMVPEGGSAEDPSPPDFASHDYSMVSDASGHYTFADVPPGSTLYAISYIDSTGEVMNITLNSDGSYTQEDTLRVQAFCTAGPDVYYY